MSHLKEGTNWYTVRKVSNGTRLVLHSCSAHREAPICTGQHKHGKSLTDVHALNGIRTYDPKLGAAGHRPPDFSLTVASHIRKFTAQQEENNSLFVHIEQT
jgi:hypothetical protein